MPPGEIAALDFGEFVADVLNLPARQSGQGLGFLLEALGQRSLILLSGVAGGFAGEVMPQDVATLEEFAVVGLLKYQVFWESIAAIAHVQPR